MLAKINQSTLLAVLLLGVVACGNDTPKSAPAKTETKPTQPAEVKPETSEAKDAKNNATENKEAEAKDEKLAETKTADSTDKKDDTPLAADAGQKRYEATCKLCHDQGLLNAPKKGDKTEWAKRLEKGKDTLYTHSIKGFNKMPAQATGDVSEAEVKAAVDYLLAQSS